VLFFLTTVSLALWLFLFLGRLTLVGKALRFTHKLSFFLFLFYRYIAFSSRAVDGHQMYLSSHGRPMPLPSLVKLGSRNPENRLSVVPHSHP